MRTKMILGVNDLATTHPDLLKEWDYERNNMLGINPQNVTAGSNKKVWWTCSKGHKWQTLILNRKNGNGCPYCSNHKVLSGYNDLATTHPKLLKEWDYEKNDSIGIKPTEVTAGSNKKVWWTCSKGHNWQTIISNRTKGVNCLYCKKFVKKIKAGVNDLATTHPDLLKEWDYEKNDALGIKPTEVTAGSQREVWWKCKNCGNEWQARIASRTYGTGCPICRKAVKKAKAGINDLATTHPDLLKEWDYEKNDALGIKPTEVTAGSNKKVWWKCKECGNEWQARISNRTMGTGCSKCSINKKKH